MASDSAIHQYTYVECAVACKMCLLEVCVNRVA